MTLTYCGLSDTGCVRQNNEDRVLLEPELGLFAVADGMGGHRYGELAAEVAVATLKSYIGSSLQPSDVTWPFGYNFSYSMNGNRLATAIRLANRQVWHQSEQGPDYGGMGSTIVAVLVEGQAVTVASVGDSRVYARHNGELKQLTTDDTWLYAVMQREAAAKAELLNHPMRNVLTQALGSPNDVEVHILDLAAAPGDTLLLSSDGLHQVVHEEGLAALLALGLPPESAARRLIEAARAEGAPDNVSCVLLGFD
jgi:serine/threonine protein phosphatase PrpC